MPELKDLLDPLSAERMPDRWDEIRRRAAILSATGRPFEPEPRRSRARLVLTAATALVLFAGAAAFVWLAFRPDERDRRPVPAAATLGLRLFVDGEIVEIVGGDATVVNDWPASVAPYRPPLATTEGIVGLAPGQQGVDLWRVAPGKAPERVARNAAHSFAVAPDGTLIYGAVGPSWQSTTLVMAGGAGGSTRTVVVDGYAAPVGSVGRSVFVGTGDGEGGSGVWDGSERLVDLPYSGVAVTHPRPGYAVVNVGDGGCWDIVRLVDGRLVADAAPVECASTPQEFSPSGTQLAGIEGRLETATTGLPDNRVVVQDVGSRTRVFRSESIDGAYQVAWEDERRLLVLARTKGSTVAVYRCYPDAEDCSRVWTVETSEKRYSVWLIRDVAGMEPKPEAAPDAVAPLRSPAPAKGPCSDRVSEGGDIDGDGVMDRVYHVYIRGDAVLGACLSTGGRTSVAGAGQAEVLALVDVEPDGRDEIVFGGTSASMAFISLAVYDEERGLRVVTFSDGAPFGLVEGLSGPTTDAAWGCEDRDGDGLRELVQVMARLTNDEVTWTKQYFDLRGGVATPLGEVSETVAAPPVFRSFARTLTDSCST